MALAGSSQTGKERADWAKELNCGIEGKISIFFPTRSHSNADGVPKTGKIQLLI
jgi:hypothetical protein